MKPLKRLALCACIIETSILCALMPIRAAAMTIVPANISADTSWGVSGNPYVMDGDMSVDRGVTLFIGEGVIVTGAGRLVLDHSTLKMVGAKLDGGPTIYALDSNVSMSSTTLYGGDGNGVHMSGGRLDISRSRFERNTGAGVYLQDSTESSVTSGIHDSVFKENGLALSSKTWVPSEAQNNWWGQSTGPIWSGPNRIEGKVFASPHLDEEQDKICCSSVLFIPGIEGTRLYDGPLLLWEPLGKWSLESLFLDTLGRSLIPIGLGEVIGKAYGIKDVYASFLGMLDSLVASSTMTEYKAYGYDWRLSADSIAGQQLEDEIRSMADRSITGRVTIVAHSNGGLVAKALISRLKEKGDSSLIDRLISVAVPYTGTPEAILSVVNGDSLTLFGLPLFPLDLTKRLAQNMPSAYGLLPSVAYAFSSSSPVTLGSVSAYSFDGLNSFLSSRSNQALLAAADAMHAALDPFEWPRQISRAALVGWNVLTTSGVNYFSRPDCRFRGLKRVCAPVEAHEPMLTSKGDGTVVSSSASYDAGQIGSFNLAEISKLEGKTINHTNILSSATIQNAVESLILDKPLAGISLEGFLFSGEPQEGKGYLQARVSGTADLKVVDVSNEQVGQTRLVRDEAGTTTYVYVPINNTGDRYSAVITGNGLGYASLNLAVVNQEGSSSSSYEPVPVLPGSTATTTLEGSIIYSGSTLEVDLDGDGSSDLVASSSSPDSSNIEASSEDIATTTVEALREALCE